MARTTVTAIIPAGQSVSSSIDLSEGTAVFFHMPAEWTSALMSFQMSSDNVTFGDLVDTAGREVSINVNAGTVIRPDRVPPKAGWLKLRSGSRHGAVAQAAERIITVTVDNA